MSWKIRRDGERYYVDADTMDNALARLIRIMGTFDLATGHADTMDQALDALEDELRDVLGNLRARREQQREDEQ